MAQEEAVAKIAAADKLSAATQATTDLEIPHIDPSRSAPQGRRKSDRTNPSLRNWFAPPGPEASAFRPERTFAVEG
jgi:hypothetical protein